MVFKGSHLIMQLIPMVDLLVDKKSTTREIHMILFEQCNIACSFCHQDHDSVVGMDSIREKTSELITSLDPKQEYRINITGGELFHDGIDDGIFEDYFYAATQLLDNLPNSSIYFGTNLLFDPTRLIALMKRFSEHPDYESKVFLTTSYDPSGRFNKATRAQFFDNLFHPDIYNLITTINVVITKGNIDNIIGKRYNDELRLLYDHFHLYFDHFIANHQYKLHQPSEERISEFYMFLKDNYPKSEPINEMLNNEFNKLTCQSTIIQTDSGKVVNCWGESGKDFTDDYEEGLRRKQKAEENFLQKYDCFSCEYYQRCTMRCFLHHHSLDNQPEECTIKQMYRDLGI